MLADPVLVHREWCCRDYPAVAASVFPVLADLVLVHREWCCRDYSAVAASVFRVLADPVLVRQEWCHQVVLALVEGWASASRDASRDVDGPPVFPGGCRGCCQDNRAAADGFPDGRRLVFLVGADRADTLLDQTIRRHASTPKILGGRRRASRQPMPIPNGT